MKHPIKNLKSGFLGFTFAGLLLAGCQPQGAQIGDGSSETVAGASACPNREQAGLNGPWLDPALSNADCRSINKVYGAIAAAKISVSEQSAFKRIFGTTDSSGVTEYLRSRVDYIASHDAPMKYDLYGIRNPIPPLSSPNAVAVNVSNAFYSLARQHGYQFFLGESPLNVNWPGRGVIQLGPRFPEFTLPTQMSTLIHEARHSDCESTDDPNCGFTHARCPDGSAFEGLSSCDDKGVGPYYIQSVYSKALAENCSNCSESQRQAALADSIDFLERVLNIDEIESGQVSFDAKLTFRGFDPVRNHELNGELRLERLGEGK